jgi:hypothetical protein
VCSCDNQHVHMLGGCKKVSRKAGEPCSSSRQCQKVKAVCRENKTGTGRWCACLANKYEDNTAYSVSSQLGEVEVAMECLGGLCSQCPHVPACQSVDMGAVCGMWTLSVLVTNSVKC